ncbi:unnamed protein product [Closterium sp. Yama58-4]|nr:unnamed protein product [Closterium sp. Yama58-4]
MPGGGIRMGQKFPLALVLSYLPFVYFPTARGMMWLICWTSPSDTSSSGIGLILALPLSFSSYQTFPHLTCQRNDVVDLLPEPIWHIIFRHLLKKQGDSWGAWEWGAGSDSYEENAGPFGSSWPVLCCAMASKRLFAHVISFHEREPFPLVVDSQEHRLAAALSFFLRHTAHTSLDLLLNTSQDLLCLRRLMHYSTRSLTSLCLDVRESPGQPLDPAFLGEFQQLQQLELRLGSWQLGNLDPARFQALRILKVHLLESNRRDLSFLSSVAPQLHEFALSCSGIGSSTLNFEFTAARSIAICFEKQAVTLRFALPASLKSFSASGHCLNVDCRSDSPLSLASFSLIGRSHLIFSSLPLASAKSVYLSFRTPENLDSQLAFTQLLSSIAPTVEKLIVRHDWPLEGVHVEWSCLRRLAIGVNRFSTEGFGYNAHMYSADDLYFLKCFGGEGGSSGGSSGSSSSSGGGRR